MDIHKNVMEFTEIFQKYFKAFQDIAASQNKALKVIRYYWTGRGRMWSLAFPFGLGRTGMGITRSKEDTVLYVSNSKMRFSTKSAVLNWNRVSVV
ncbi:hypothetical protein LEP1GSC161_2274 [Leptospira santarosai str. CBC1416]|uniref:Uncharacterized protein n=1 Tax=Leptospira santarosai str. CBC1416 TaxID=1193059 RepID=M6VX12_9LEPT|nr:hypothetical protein LEP1GSC161_2274 [Leptospira santarosai str. CBC1416]